MDQRSPWPRRFRRIVLILAIIYVLLCILITVAQRRMIYFPTRVSAGAAQGWAAASQLTAWTNSSGQEIGWKRLASGGQVLILHGNAGCALDRDFYVEKFQEAKAFDVYILEFPGYGSRPGSPTQISIFQAASDALKLLKTRGPVYVVGESLGTGAACYLAGTFPDSVAGLALVAPYNNFTAAARAHMPLFPVRWMLWDRYSSDSYLKNYKGPAAFLVAGRDQVVPPALGRKLFAEYTGAKRLWEYPQATHNDVHSIAPNVWREVVAFWSETNRIASVSSPVRN